MLAVREALDDLTLKRDGVDGKRIYVYGEGWDFGEVAGGALFRQARQLELFGIRHRVVHRPAARRGPWRRAVRRQTRTSRGSPPASTPIPTETPSTGRRSSQLPDSCSCHHDQIKVGLAGNLRDFDVRRPHRDDGHRYRRRLQRPAGRVRRRPVRDDTYVDAHDNETLFDIIQYKLPQSTLMADRVRMNTVALATTALAQSPSFWHAGTDLLRSKSYDPNSFDSGDWFNRMDWSATESTWGSGLPPPG